MRFASAVTLILATLGPHHPDGHSEPHALCRFLPDNALVIPVSHDSTGLTEGQYHALTELVRSSYAPVFKDIGQTLVMQADWTDAQVNSFATRDDADNPVVVAPGGIARHPLMTSDGMVAILCHEIGHFLGGAPKQHRGDTERLSWSSAEGEADYFSAAKCMKVIFSDDAENQTAIHALPEEKQTELAAKCSCFQCMRLLEAGQAVASLFAAVTVSPPPSLTNPDEPPSSTLIYTHPSPQCRLETFVAGARCDASPTSPMNNLDPAPGACMTGVGERPRCWFQ